ncbi:MAG: LOG family protein [Acidobacteriota bacterium]
MTDLLNDKMPPLAYLNDDFLKSSEARALRILSEYLEPRARLRRFNLRDTIVFFGSARSVAPDIAEARLAELQKQNDDSPEYQDRIAKAEQLVHLSRYYQDAVDLARRITEWSKSLTGQHHFIICSGGSGGMMEAANRGASLARGKTIGLNIELPHEQDVNKYVSRELVFNFHYFFMRKFWFVYPAKALIAFPGGFGTMDELFEVLTLIQTKKPGKTMPVLLFGKTFWDEVINFDALVKWGVVSPQDLDIFFKTDSVDEAFEYVTGKLEKLYLSDKGLEEVKLT